MTAIATVDVSALLDRQAAADSRRRAGRALDASFQRSGFCLITGHGVPVGLHDRLDRAAGEFFALPETEKSRIAMAHAGAAWRGWFPVGAELTSGRPDRKEGIYFGSGPEPDDPRAHAGVPLHGDNLFPERPAALRSAVLAWMAAVTRVGQCLLEGLEIAFGLPSGWFSEHVTADPTVLFRIFHYPPSDAGDATAWGVGEHTDYGLLTLLAQDGHGGLQVQVDADWVDVPPDRGTFVVNCGDMLERMTRGRYRSAPHRVRNLGGQDRLSFPLFLDPSWDATVVPLPASVRRDGPAGGHADHARWDGADVHAWEGTYGQYLTQKVSRVFPDLFSSVAHRASDRRDERHGA